MTDRHGVGTFVNDESELTTSALDIFSVPSVDTTLKSGRPVYYYPVNAVTNEGPFEFHIAKDPDSYINMPMTRLEGEVQVVKNDGTALAVADHVVCVNLFTQSLFRQVEIEINGTQVCDLSTPTYAYKSFIESHLTFSDDAKSTHLRCSMFEKDTLDNETSTTTNTGGNTRTEKVLGTTFYFSNIIHCDILQCHRFMIPGTDIRIRFIRNADSFSLISTTPKAKILINNLKLSVRKIKIDPKVKEAQEHLLKSMPALYPLTQAKIKTFVIPIGTQSIELPSIIQGKLPKQLIIGFVNSQSFNGVVTGNPFFFNHRNVNFFNLKVNGEPVVADPFKPSWANGNYYREYRHFLDNIGIAHGNETNGITDTEFKQNSNFWVFDFTPDLCNSFHLHSGNEGHMDLNVGFTGAIAVTALHMIVYATFNQVIAIDADRKVTVIE